MVTFKNIFGEVVKTINNPMTSSAAEKMAEAINAKKKNNAVKIAEIDFNNGSFLFL